jgi:hypothetical protein
LGATAKDEPHRRVPSRGASPRFGQPRRAHSPFLTRADVLPLAFRAVAAKLPPEDRAIAEKQKVCPVTDAPLRSMGVPDKVTLKGKTVFLCCEGCEEVRIIGLVILKRVRFIAVLACVGPFICKWEMVMNYWEKSTRPRGVAAQELEPGQESYCPIDPQVIRSTDEPNGDVPKCPSGR